MSSKRVFLSENEMPSAWYNLQADLPEPLPPPLNPATNQPVGPADLEPIFPPSLIAQEVSRERWIEIPEEVQHVFRLWRSTPLVRATELEKHLKTPARIYYKDESVSPAGSHKPNTAVPQAYYNNRPESSGLRPRPPASGAARWRLPARCSASSARSTWSR